MSEELGKYISYPKVYRYVEQYFCIYPISDVKFPERLFYTKQISKNARRLPQSLQSKGFI